MIQLYAGNAAEGARLARQALRLNPLMPTNSQLILGQALIHVDECEEAISVLESVARRRPRWLTARTMLVAARSRMGETDEAKRLAAEVLRINPRFTVARWGDRFPYRDRGELDALMAPLLEAGLPND
jgi:predicted Zn-dependent protease